MFAETINQAFESFFTTEPLGQGTGLGLSVIYGFARQFGGQVRIYSALGQDATVCIYLPRHQGPVDDDFFVLAMLWLWRSWRRFRWMARHDGLTGTRNREHFFVEAGRRLRQLHKAKADACLAVLDLDHFKRINDTHGHAAGDQVLRSAATIIGRELRATDLLGRLGGEEFGILISGCSCDQGLEVANRIRHALATTPVTLDSQVTVMVSASLGLACASSSSYMLRLLLIDADAALYRAKEGGRNQVVVDTHAELASVAPPDNSQLPLNA